MSGKLEIIKQIEDELTESGNDFLDLLKKAYYKLNEEEIDPAIGISVLVTTVVKMETAFNKFKIFALED
jgi:hypothetical protein